MTSWIPALILFAACSSPDPSIEPVDGGVDAEVARRSISAR